MPTDALEPIRLPAEFWQRTDVLTSLDERDIGALFRLIRRHTGASQHRIGTTVDMPQSRISLIMNTGPKRRRVTAHNVITRIADGLHMPNHARARLGLAPQSQPTTTATPHHETVTPPGTSTPAETTSRALDRLLNEAGLSRAGLARRVNELADAVGLYLDHGHSSVYQGISKGEPLRKPTPRLIAAVLSNALGRPIALEDIGMPDPHRSSYETRPKAQTGPPDDPERPQELVVDHSSSNDTQAAVTIVPSGGRTEMTLSRRSFMELSSGLLAASIAGGPSDDVPAVIDPAIVEYFATHRALLVEADTRLGDIGIFSAVQQQIRVIARFRRQARGTLRNQLLSMEARWAEFAGWLSDDLGDYTTGTKWLDLAMSMSLEAADDEFVAYTLARAAQRAAITHDEDRVVGLAEASIRAASASPPVQAFAVIQQAHGNALAGKHGAFQQAIEHARELTAAVSSSASDLASFCTPAYLHAQEAEGWLRIGDPRSAIACFDKATAQWPSSHPRERGRYLARTATAHLMANEPDQAAVTAQHALSIAVTTRSTRIRREVELVAKHAHPFRSTPAVRNLLDLLEGTAS